MSKVLIIRFSAIGDVAMTLPIVYSAAKMNPDDSFTMLTQTFLMPLFMNRPENVTMMGVNMGSTEKSVFGFLRYVFILRKYQFDKVLDLHDVIRSWLVDAVFLLSGKKIFRIDKGRRDRKRITARPPKEIFPLRPVTQRYADVFRKAGFKFEETFVSLFENRVLADSFPEEKKGKWIGIAPFAKHKGKRFPLEKMETVVRQLSEKEDFTIFLFGGKGEEAEKLNGTAEKYPNVRNVAGRYSFDNELVLISRLDALVSMDSANMHFASLVGTKVISVWGATHPYAGFYGYHQSPDLAVQADLPCRPCSIYGKKPCFRKDWACLNAVTVEMILHKIMNVLDGESHCG